ncbi:MAG: diguanylate cyclase [Actinobacteria bacterium]|nr:diguanylate cyclase [Actinomycetota bacterium]
MVDARVIALVLGVVGAAFGISALVFDTGAFGAAAGAAAIGAGVVALWARPQTGGSPTEEDLAERDRTIDRTRRELAEARSEIDALRSGELHTGGPTAGSDPAAAAEVVAVADTSAAVPDPTPLLLPGDDTATRGGHEQIPASGPSTLTDVDSQLFSEAYFLVALQSRLASARRHLRPVSVCLMEVTEGQNDADAGPPPAGRVADAIRQTVREADIACRMDDGTFAVILEDTPENGAVWTVERTRRNLVSRFGTHTMWAGVACYPAHAFSGDELVTQARAALRSAQEWNQDRIEVAAVES